MGLDFKLILNYVVAGIILMLLTKFVLNKIPLLSSYEVDSYDENVG